MNTELPSGMETNLSVMSNWFPIASILEGLLGGGGRRGKLISDSQQAQLPVEHGQLEEILIFFSLDNPSTYFSLVKNVPSDLKKFGVQFVKQQLATKNPSCWLEAWQSRHVV